MPTTTRRSLDRLEVRFVTFRETSADERAAVADRYRSYRADESVLIETCHRVELIALGAQPVRDRGPRGGEAVRRVFEVVAGFDSAVMAEEQLLNQVRRAYQEALGSGTSGPVLNELMRRALRFGRRVRSHAQPGTDRSLADPAAAWLQERLPAGAPVVVAGTGEMGRLVATRLARAGHPISIVSGSRERAQRLLGLLPAGDHCAVVGPMTRELVGAAAAITLAVRTPSPALTLEVIGPAVPWVVDLSVPGSVEPAARMRLGERLLDLDGLGARHAVRPVLAGRVEARLRQQLADEVEAFAAWMEMRQGADALSVLQAEADAVRRRHLDRLRRRSALDDEQMAAVDASSAAMVNELLHGPIVELRHGGTDAATVRRLFRIDA